jgi:hypothetical protein
VSTVADVARPVATTSTEVRRQVVAATPRTGGGLPPSAPAPAPGTDVVAATPRGTDVVATAPQQAAAIVVAPAPETRLHTPSRTAEPVSTLPAPPAPPTSADAAHWPLPPSGAPPASWTGAASPAAHGSTQDTISGAIAGTASASSGAGGGAPAALAILLTSLAALALVARVMPQATPSAHSVRLRLLVERPG